MGLSTFRRRYCALAEARAAAGEDAIAMVYQAKADAVPAHPLPLNFPGHAALVKQRYTTLEDLVGVDKPTLVALKDIADKTAVRILEAFAVAVAARAEGQPILPDGFPARDAFVAAGYTTLPSLHDHAATLLARVPGVTPAEARLAHDTVAGKVVTPLPDTFPHREALAAAGVIALEQLEGLKPRDLTALGLAEDAVDEILEALEPPAPPAPEVAEDGGQVDAPTETPAEPTGEGAEPEQGTAPAEPQE